MHNKYIKFFVFSLFVIVVSFAVTYHFVLNFEKFPSLNKYYINKINEKYYSDKQFGIFDMFGGSFKTFILNNDTPKLLDKLYANLDNESIEKVNLALNAILHIPDTSYMKYFYFRSKEFEKDFTLKLNTFTLDKIPRSEIAEIEKKYILPEGVEYFSGVFLHEHNLRFANDKIKNYIKDKIFIDGGAFVGDSALVLLKYNPSLIYSFEMSKQNIERFHQTMKMNNVPKNKVELIEYAISDSVGEHKIRGRWEMEGIEPTIPLKNEGITVKSTDIDTFMKDKNGKVGFIKADLQGIMHKAVNGMKETIKRDRPVLFLDISDSPQDFFYTKPIIEDILKDLNYTLKITSLNASVSIVGTAIWAYPKELEE